MQLISKSKYETNAANGYLKKIYIRKNIYNINKKNIFCVLEIGFMVYIIFCEVLNKKKIKAKEKRN